jgi:hypothetical protein
MADKNSTTDKSRFLLLRMNMCCHLQALMSCQYAKQISKANKKLAVGQALNSGAIIVLDSAAAVESA